MDPLHQNSNQELLMCQLPNQHLLQATNPGLHQFPAINPGLRRLPNQHLLLATNPGLHRPHNLHQLLNQHLLQFRPQYKQEQSMVVLLEAMTPNQVWGPGQLQLLLPPHLHRYQLLILMG